MINKRVTVFLAIAFSTLLSSCQKDDDTGGTDERSKFLGTWNMNSNGTVSGHLAYSMDVVASASSPTQILMKNFDFQGNNANTIGEVSGNSITIHPQLIGSDSLEGTGSYNNQQLHFNYTVWDGTTTDVVSATGTN